MVVQKKSYSSSNLRYLLLTGKLPTVVRRSENHAVCRLLTAYEAGPNVLVKTFSMVVGYDAVLFLYFATSVTTHKF